MITLHHLNQSRSKRIIWLLESIGIDYEIISYQRDKQTFLAPPELLAIHPLGKSPVITDDGQVIAESGAITEYLITKYAPQFAPKPNTNEYVEYLQWLHFAESSAILPLLLSMFIKMDGCKTNFINDYSNNEINKVMTYLNQSLESKEFLVDNKLTGADFMMSFIAEILEKNNEIQKYENIDMYLKRLMKNDNYQKSNLLEKQYDK